MLVMFYVTCKETTTQVSEFTAAILRFCLSLSNTMVSTSS